MLVTLPVFNVPLHCINQVAVEFHVPAKLIIAVLEVENGKNGQISQNTNGTYDIGLMQINSQWLPQLKSYGISQYDLQYNACLNLKVGTWILARNIAKQDDLLTGIGDYHSHTSHLNKKYYDKVRMMYTNLSLALNKK